MSATRSLVAIQAAYNASGRPAGTVLYRWRSGWWVRLHGGKYERLPGRRWREVVTMLRIGK